MTSWIDHAQRHITSNFKDQSAWRAAQAACPNPRICDFLSELPLRSKEAFNQAITLAESLQADRQEVSAQMVRYLAYLPSFLPLHSPLQISSGQRESLFKLVQDFAQQTARHHELLPCAGVLYFILGTGFGEMQEYTAARRAYEEALIIFRQLVTDQRSNYLENVAMILNNLGNLLRNMHDFPTARTAFDEAREIYCELAADQPSDYLPDVAMTLNNLSVLLQNVGDFSAARTGYEEALKIRRQLAADQPAAYLPDLAMSLNNLGLLLRDMRDFPAARTAQEEALEIRRTLAADQPAAYLPDVAATLNHLANLLRDLRDFTAARIACEKSCAIYRQLAAEQPAVYLPDMGQTLNNLGVLLRNVGDFSAARTAYDEALEVRRQLTADQLASYQHDVAGTLNNLGVLLLDVHDFPAARTAFEEARDIYRRLAGEQPATYLPNVAASLNNLALVLRSMDDFPAARTAFEETLEIRRQLAVNQPPAYLPDVAMTLNNLGNLLSDRQDFHAARKAYEEAVQLAEVTHRTDTLHHLAKNNVTDAYQYLLADAVAVCATEKAFAFAAAMRDGRARSASIGQGELRATQDWLRHQSEQSGFLHRLLIPSSGSGGQLVLGLIDQEECRFVSLRDDVWKGLFPGFETIKNHLMRRQLARELWQSLPDAFQMALAPTPGRKQFIAISGDPFWSAFPWELLRFGESIEDYLGLHYALPRLNAIQAKDLQSQLSVTELGKPGGRISVLAPFDTGLIPLTGVVDEIESVRQNVEMRGGDIVAFAKGLAASDLEIERQISLQPDIFYYSGHGTIVQVEELLVLHRDMSTKNAMSSTTYFGKEQLAILAKNKGGRLFSDHPLIVLNSCLTGRARQAGGAREDLTSAFLALGAGAVIATALPIYDVVGKGFGEALFDPAIAKSSDIGSVVVGTRRRLAREVCADVESPFWGAWSMIHLHGSARATLPFNTPPGEE